jgi:hypothetical protein
MKIYQIKYTNYGIVKYCYSSNFVDIYLNFTDVEIDKDKLIFPKEFYDALNKFNGYISK